MPLDVDTVLVTIFTRVDDFCKQHCKIKSGPAPKMADSEIITLSLFSELAGKNSDYQQILFATQWLKSYFPNLIDRSRYNRRMNQLQNLINQIRKEILNDIVMEIADCHIIDSTPLPIMDFKKAGRTPIFPEGNFGYCASKKKIYFGFKLHLITDTQGIPLHFDITSANIADNQMIEELLSVCSKGRLVLGDKGYLFREIQEKIFACFGIKLITPKRKNQKNRELRPERKLFSGIRQKIEIVNKMLKDKFNLEKTYARTLMGLVTRILRKITAFTFGIYLNKLFGRNILALSSIVG